MTIEPGRSIDPERLRDDVDALIGVADRVEERLSSAGEEFAHDWMFGLREVLLDFRRVLPMVAALDLVDDADNLRPQVREVAYQITYLLVPHANSHLLEVLDSIDRVTGDDEQPARES